MNLLSWLNLPSSYQNIFALTQNYKMIRIFSESIIDFILEDTSINFGR